MGKLERYYNKFNEEGRLTRRHGIVEFETTMHFVRKEINNLQATNPNRKIDILDCGCGTGKYSTTLWEEGHNVTAMDLVSHNVTQLKKKNTGVIAMQGNATDLSQFNDQTFDIILLLGPMYHLISEAERITALKESARVLRPGGYIFVAYCMNEYSVITYGFKEGHMGEIIQAGKIDQSAGRLISTDEELYWYARLEDTEALAKAASLQRKYIFSADGAANYMRKELSAMPHDMFEHFMQYHLATCLRPELMGAGFHTVDVLTK